MMSRKIIKIEEFVDEEGRIIRQLSPVNGKDPVKYNGMAILMDKSGNGMNFEFPLSDNVKGLEDAFELFDEHAKEALANYEKERSKAEKDKSKEIVIPSGGNGKIITV
jgi:hypothetical protein